MRRVVRCGQREDALGDADGKALDGTAAVLVQVSGRRGAAGAYGW
ncbi:hypothetical protein ACFOSC_15150 [Streptantibioticus rubrisoli]|nr:hypothetical protein [Streptantibioticus rubrisoli]